MILELLLLYYKQQNHDVLNCFSHFMFFSDQIQLVNGISFAYNICSLFKYYVEQTDEQKMRENWKIFE